MYTFTHKFVLFLVSSLISLTVLNAANIKKHPSVYTENGEQWITHNLSVKSVDTEYKPFGKIDYRPYSDEEQQILLLKSDQTKVHLEVLATRLGFDKDITSTNLNESYQEYLSKKGSKILETTEENVNGIDWTVYKVKKKFNKKTVLNFNYRAYVNGILYTNIIWCYKGQNTHPNVKKEAHKLIKCIHILDSNFYAYSKSTKKVNSISLPEYGLHLNLENQHYTMDKGDNEESLLSYYSYPNNAFLFINPIYTGDKKLTLNEVIRGYELMLDASYSQNSELKKKTVPELPGKAVDFTYKLYDEDDNHSGYAITRFIKSSNTASCIRIIRFDTDLNKIQNQFESLVKQLTLTPTESAPNLNEAQSLDHANFYNGVGVMSYERNNLSKAIYFFSRSHDLEPENLQFATNLIQGYINKGDAEKALNLSEKSLEKSPDDVMILNAKGKASFQLKHIDKGIEAYRKIFFELDSYTPQLINEYLNYLYLARENHIISEEIQSLRELDAAPETLAYWEIAILRDAGELDKANTIATDLYTTNPENINIASIYADLLIRQKKFADALQVCDETIEVTGDQQMSYFKGLTYVNLQQYAAAKETLQTCLDAMPGHVNARNLLNHLHTLMGNSDPSLYTRPIKPVPLDPFITSIEAKDADTYLKRKGAYAPYTGQATHFKPGQKQRTTHYLKFRILDEKGVQKFKEISRTFNPNYEHIFVNEANIYDNNDQLISKGDPLQYYLTDRGEDSIVNEQKTLHITYPNVSVGCTMTLTITYETNSPVDTFQYQGPVLSGTYPREYTFVQISGDTQQLTWAKNLPEIEFNKIDDKLIWYTRTPNTYENVLYPPEVDSFMPTLWIASEQPDGWETIANEYYAKIEDLLDARSPTIEDIASSLVHDDTITSKIDSVFEYISENYTYKALLFGPKARIPHTIGEIIRNKFGDCKDHTLLAHHLLRELGIQSWPVLVDTYRGANPKVPSLEQFNHMILYVPDANNNQFIDPTDRFYSPRYTPRNLDQQPALIIKKNDSFITEIPPYRERDNKISIKRTVTIEESQKVKVQEDITLQGMTAAYVRGMLFNVPQADRPQALQSYLRQAEPSISVESLEIENINNSRNPLSLKYKYTLSRSFIKDGSILQGRCPSTWDNLFYYHNKSENRYNVPIRVATPFHVELDLLIQVPKNYHLNKGDHLADISYSNEFGSHNRTLLGTTPLRFNYQYVINSNTYDSDKQSDFIAHAEKAIQSLAIPISFEIK